MKFFLVGLILSLMISTTAMSQNANVGIKGGLNVYNVVNDNNAGADSKVGFHVGLLGHVHLSDQWALQPELTYSVQGGQSTIVGADVKLNLNYINVPVLLQYMFDNGFRIQAGPQLGLLVSAKMNNSETDVKDNFENFDLGIGVGVSYINPASSLGFDARYNVGLSNINVTSNDNAYNRGLQVGVFYLFKHIKHK